MNSSVNRVLVKIFFKHIITYISIALLVIFMLIPVYKSAYVSSKENMINKLEQELQIRLDTFDQMLYSSYVYMYDILNNDKTIRIAHALDSNNYHLDLGMQLVKDMGSRLVSQTMPFNDAILLFKNSDIVVLMNSVSNREKYYGTKCEFDGLTREQFERKAFNGEFISLRNIKTKNNTENRKGIAITYTGNAIIQPYVVGCVVIYENVILDMLLESSVEKYGSMKVVDKDGNVFCEYGTTEKENNETTVLALNGFHKMCYATFSLRDDAFADTVSRVKKLVIILCALSFACAILLSVAFSIKTFAPLRKYIKRMPNSALENKLNFSSFTTLLDSALINLTSSKYSLEETLMNLKSHYRNMIIYMLLNGVKVNEDIIKEEFSDGCILSDSYVVVLFDIHSNRNSIVESTRALEKLGTELKCLFHRIYIYNNIAIIGHESPDNIYSELEKLSYRMQTTTGFATRFIISKQYTGKEKLCEGYGETLRYQKNLVSSNENEPLLVNCSSDENLLPETVMGSFKLSEFYEIIMTANSESLKTYMRKISDQYATIYAMFPQRIIALYYNIVEALEAALASVHIGYHINEYNPLYDYDATFTYLTESSITVQKIVQESRNNDKYTKILKYIDENISNPDMCLSMLAEHFAMSEAYISRLIKSSTGCTYSEYLESKRMKIAVDLIQNSNLNIQEICEAIGYTNQNTFFKAFKRYYHVSPGNYRKNLL